MIKLDYMMLNGKTFETAEQFFTYGLNPQLEQADQTNSHSKLTCCYINV